MKWHGSLSYVLLKMDIMDSQLMHQKLLVGEKLNTTNSIFVLLFTLKPSLNQQNINPNKIVKQDKQRSVPKLHVRNSNLDVSIIVFCLRL